MLNINRDVNLSREFHPTIFFDYLQMIIDQSSFEKYHLSDDEKKQTMQSYVSMNIKANDYFLKEDQVCNYFGVVIKGLLRSYFVDDFANEITTDFYPYGL